MDRRLHTSVAIVGAGPAGLFLSQLLARAGISSCVLERRSREHVEGRVRAGVLEQGTVDALCSAGVGARLSDQGLVHHGVELRFDGRRHRIAFEELTPGRSITVYGQREVVKDLIEARLQAIHAGETASDLLFDVESVQLRGVASESPSVSFRRGGEAHRLECDWIAGCDGFRGVSRGYLPTDSTRVYERTYPFCWLGVLASVPPSTTELIYAHHERGFALHSMRSRELSRFYLQVPTDDSLDAWPDARIWQALRGRLETVDGWHLRSGPILERSITAMRSFVVEPMRHGRLLLAGDAAHIVPATGAKGLNLAISDVQRLASALAAWYGDRGRPTELLDVYSDACLRRVWRVQDFSRWMTELFHRLPGEDAYQRRLRLAQLDALTTSRAAATVLAENYVGL